MLREARAAAALETDAERPKSEASDAIQMGALIGDFGAVERAAKSVSTPLRVEVGD
jgi:hypothetical protein